MTQPLWHALSSQDTLSLLNTNEHGLSSAEVTQRLLTYGPNTLGKIKRTHWLVRLLLQFHNPLIYVLLASAIITAILHFSTDSIMIAAAAVINALIGFFQENKAERALQAIHHLLAPTAVVVRNHQRETIAASELVPGDIVLLKSGDRVPADMRLLNAKSLRVNEALLTGESGAVDKSISPVDENAAISERYCMLYAATSVAYGTAQGVVVSTAQHTELGKISVLLHSTPKLITPLIQQLKIFTRHVLYIISAIASITFLYGYFIKQFSFHEIFSSVIALSVAAIPEGLPATMSIILAIAVIRMTKHNAIVRWLPAIETLSSVSVICTDKTGTLTRNEMTANTIITANNTYTVTGIGYDPIGEIQPQIPTKHPLENESFKLLITIGALCNDAQLIENNGVWKLHGDPLDGALLTLAKKAQLDRYQEQQHLPMDDFIPFESEHKFMASLHHDHEHHHFIYVKGAPEEILTICNQQYPHAKLDQEHWRQKIEHLTKQGQRVIAVAMKPMTSPQNELAFSDIQHDFYMVGVIGFLDAPREEVKSAIEECLRAGIQVKMITGDHAETARAVANSVGIDTSAGIMLGSTVDILTDAELITAAVRVNAFARMLPKHKLRLVKALQATGQTVAMTGDGVNDSPALKLANIGIAMGKGGSEAARETAEIVLTDDNFTTIEQAVKAGRTVYNNLKKVLFFMLPTNAAEALTISLAVIFGLTIPVTAVQILWVNMITAVTLAIAIAFEPAEADVMQLPPRNPHEPLFSKLLFWRVCIVASFILIGVFSLFWWQHALGANLITMRTIAMNALVFAEVAYVFNCRRAYKLVWGIDGFFSNRAILIAVSLVTLFQLLMTYTTPFHTFFGVTSLPASAWLGILIFIVTLFFLVELIKWFERHIA